MDIAIIGMAGRFPDARNVDELFENLKKGRDSVREISPERIRSTTLASNETYYICGYLDDIDKFDNKLFNISLGEAQTMSPVQRQLIEVVYNTIESAGYSIDYFNGTNTAVFVGASPSDYYKHADCFMPTLVTGNMDAYLPSVIARQFNFTGNAQLINTACSSSLVAVHNACNELILGNAEYAIVCGANIYEFPHSTMSYAKDDKTNLESPDGKSKAFSAEANGISHGEAAVGILLKPLDQAIEDKDIIYAVIKSTVVNNNAKRSESLKAVDSVTLSELLKTAWAKAKVSPDALGYIEAHGSGTKLGDALEIEGLDLAFRSFSEAKRVCPISTIKSNIGHTRMAAGITGLVRAVLSLKNRVLFPTANFRTPSPLINFEESSVYVNEDYKYWEAKDSSKRYAGVTSLGESGTNCHVVLCEAPDVKDNSDFKNYDSHLITISSNSWEGLKRNLDEFKKEISQLKKNNLQDISYTLNKGRKHYEYRFAAVIKDLDELNNQIEKQIYLYNGSFDIPKKLRKLVFVLSDHEKVPEDVLNYFIANHEVFREELERCNSLCCEMNENTINFAFQYSLYRLLIAYGVSTNKILGTGIGRIVYETISGELTLQEGLKKAFSYNGTEIIDLNERIESFIKREAESGTVAFIELGTKSIISKKIEECITDNKNFHVFYLRDETQSTDPLLDLFKFLYLNIYDINWNQFHKFRKGNKVQLPLYQFDKTRCWIRETPKTITADPRLDNLKILRGENISEIEDEISKYWWDVLEIDELSVTDNFFEIGGDSLKATQVINAIIKGLGIKLSFEDIFDYPTIRLLARYISSILRIEEKLAIFWRQVLKVENVNMDDDFFELGGHSLLASQVLIKIKKEFSIELSFEDIFTNSTLKALAGCIDKQLKNGECKITHKDIERANERKYYKLSSAQKRMFLLNQLDKTSIGYNNFGALTIEGFLNKDQLEKAFNCLIERHESLRTSFEIVDGEPMQKIHKDIEFLIEYIESKEEDVPEVLRNFVRPFDLRKAPLLRVAIIKFRENRQILAFDIHHIISDGTSMGILIKELSSLYNNEKLPELRIQYKDYAVWQNEILESEKIAAQKEYWLRELDGELSALDLPTDYARPSVQSFEGDTVSAEINEELVNRIRKLTKETGTTLYMIFLSAFNILLSKYCRQEDIIIGSPIAGRPHTDLENIIGMFVNTLVMKNRPEGSKRYLEFLSEVKYKAIKAYENQDYQFEELVENIKAKRETGRNPIFDVVFVMQNMKVEAAFLDGLELHYYKSESKVSKFDLTLSAMEVEGKVRLNMEYCVKLFNKKTIENMLKHLINILKEITKDPEVKLNDISMLSDEEKNQILFEFNDTYAEYPKDKTIHELFEEQVLKNPDNIAVVCMDKQLTYRELNEKSNKIARTLRAEGIVPDIIVGIITERSLEMIIGIIGILKAGGAYLPIDPEYPKDRIGYMLKDSRCELLVIQEHLKETIEFDGKSIFVDCENITGDECNLEQINQPNNLAYIIYTSGTTGKAKGAMIEHKNVVRLMFNDKMQFEFDSKDVWTLFHSYCFDFSVWEMYGALLYGGRLVIVPKATTQDPSEYVRLLSSESVTVLNQTPSAFYRLSEEELQHKEHILQLRYVIFGGEALQPAKLKNFSKKYPTTKLINMYGITETTVHVTYKEITNEEISSNTSNIGKALPTLTTYVMGKNLELLPIGIAGELCVGGEGVSRGYLNRPELTAEKFVTNPYIENEKIYKSGDLVRLLPNGDIEFLGRIDQQVKVRGYRVELGEIENQLLSYEAIKEAVVAAKEDEGGNRHLCAYIAGEKSFSVSELRAHLGQTLPDYMIPSYFVQLEKMPLTPNGKLNRKALPEPDGSITTGVEYEAPRNAIEEKLASVWQEVLKMEKVGINDNFFELGGHSLKATNLVGRIHKELGVEIPLRVIFKTPTIKGLTEYIKASGSNRFAAIPPAKEAEYCELSPAQNRLYTLQLMDKDSIAYNISGFLEISGEIDRNKLESTFKELVKRHESLRTSFELSENGPKQKIHKEIDFAIQYEEVKEEEIEGILKSLIKPFDLAKAPLFRVGLIKCGLEEKYILVYDLHHIISDGISSEILAEEFIKLYEGKELPELGIQYKDYAHWQLSKLESGELSKYEEYWLREYEGEVPVLNLPADYPRPGIQSYEGDIHTFKLEETLLAKLKAFAAETGATLFMVLLEILSVALSKYSGQEDIVIGTVSAGRLNEGTERLVGLFLNNIALRCLPKKEKTAIRYLRELKESVVYAYENQSYPIEELIGKLKLKKDMSRNALFDVMLILQNFERGSSQIASESFRMKPYHWVKKVSDYDMSVYAEENGNELVVNIQYCTRLFKEKTIESFGKHFCKIADEIASKPEQQLIDIPMLEKQEAEKVIYGFNNKNMDYEKDKTLHRLFEEQVERTPGNIAAVYEEKQLSYRELNIKANKLARHIKRYCTEENFVVGIMTEKSLEMLVGILAVLKAGGAYLPIDPSYPQERIGYMLEDSRVKLLMVQEGLKAKIETAAEKIVLEDEAIYQGDGENYGKTGSSSDLAYIIYTSGTTGKPKGIMTEHRNVIAYVSSFNNMFKLTEKDVTLQQASITFDGFVEETYSMLTCGGKVVIPRDEQVKEAKELKAVIDKKRVTILSCSPLILSEFNKLEPMESVHTFLSSSDILKREYYTNIIKKAKVYNMYGPSEATVCSTCYQCTGEETKVPIGRPISNYKLYILDEKQQPQPVGVPGEIYISGEGIARGYINKAGLSREKFLKNPFIEGERMYRTGDMARWLENGNIEFTGRTDLQVKIRGYRIEIGEIEGILIMHEAIQEAVVIAREDEQKEKYLAAYITANRKLSAGEIRKYLKEQLPEYMLPQYYIQLEKMPLTQNGKIDKKILDEYDFTVETGVEYEAPGNELEEKLAAIWQEVLKVEKVGINDNFFELGGHSLRATSVIGKINQLFDIEIPLREMFKTPTIKGIAEYISGLGRKPYEAVVRAEHREYYPVTSIQKRIYIIQQFDDTNISYNTPSVMVFDGMLDKRKFEAAFKLLVERHEAFRTSFEFEGEQIVQKIHDLDFQIEDYEANEAQIPKMIKKFVRPFDLSKAPLLRVNLVETAIDRHVLMLDAHHIILDGTSVEIMVDEFMKLYEGIELEPLKIQYKDYAVWQNEIADKAVLKAQENYWLKEFEGEIPVLSLNADFPRPEVQSSEGDTYSILLGKELSEHLNELAVSRRVTLFTLLLAIYSITVSRYSGQKDIVIGTVTAGRSKEEIQQLVGVFLNNISFRCKIDEEKCFDSYLADLMEIVINGYENQDYPVEELIEKLDLKKDMSRNTLFDVMLILQNFEDRISKNKNDAFSINMYPYENKTSKCDITLYVLEGKKGIILNFEYCTRLFKKETIVRFAQHFSNIAGEIAADPCKQLKEINMLSEGEKQQLLYTFNASEAFYPYNKVFQELFEEQAEKTPDRIAVVYKNEHMTYRQLNQKSNQLARRLREKGIKNESIVGVMVYRSIEMVVSIMAILKAGGAYLPIDPEYPQDRIEYMLYDSDVKILLTQMELAGKLQFKGVSIDVKNSSLYAGDSGNLQLINKPEDLVYVIYTSGTTGKPKGVMVEHRNLINIAMGWRKDYDLDGQEISLLQMASMSFDVFAGDLSRALLNGGKMVICPSDVRLDPVSLYKLMKEHEISMFEATPSLILPLMDYIYDSNLEVDWLKLLILGSDSCLTEDFRRLLERFSANMRILNSYGVTEATIDSSYYEASEKNIEGAGNVPIGKPMQNTRFYILDESLKPKPIGQYGELYIGGAGVARGYMNKPELTEERFLPDPFMKGGRMYKTGDMARWDSNGNVEFLGRLDNQVKIRGFRIELGEIENCLTSHESIKDAVVVPWGESSDKYLCAYILAEEAGILNTIRSYLAEFLPDYMIPSCFMRVDSIPLTPNGKVDRKALPEPLGYARLEQAYEAPLTQTEKDMVRVWEELFHREDIGVSDNFFELGGHSLKATMLVGRLYKDLGFELPLKEVFKTPTIRALAEFIDTHKHKGEKYGDEDVILLRKDESSKRNLFLIHDISCDVNGYKDFCSNMNVDFNCWGIKKGTGKTYSPVSITVEEIAAAYVKKIRTIQPEGPYYLGGWSIGGIIAFEIARQLEHQVESMWLFDTDSPSGGERVEEAFGMASEMTLISSILPADWVSAKTRTITTTDELWLEAVKYMKMHGVEVESIIKHAPGYAKQILKGIEKAELSETVRYLNTIRTINRAVYAYKPSKKLQARLHLIKAKDSSWLKPSKWKAYTENNYEVTEIEGDHFTILSEPNVHELIKAFENNAPDN